jgi:prepilin-type N-terminal cleavage/methylation domain-containing protein/prepilin-type processing-associated H-X9-DG protein
MKTFVPSAPANRPPAGCTRARRPCDAAGFTLIELLVVVAIIAILAAMLIPSLNFAKQKAQQVKCMNNVGQLTVAWKAYTDDNSSVFPFNEPGGASNNWVCGWFDYNNGSYPTVGADTNIDYLINPKYAQLGPYMKAPSAYKCPADFSCQFGRTGLPRVRSYSMNQAIGYSRFGTDYDTLYVPQGWWLPSTYAGGPYRCYFKESFLGSPAPSLLWLFIDEHPDSINDGAFAVQMADGNETQWVDIPSKYHANGCCFAFVDGHSEMHKWKISEGIPNVAWDGEILPPPITANPDVWWVSDRTSARADGQPNPFPWVP